MKKIILIVLILPFLGLGQVQIGQDIDGELENDLSGSSVSLSSNGTIVAIGAPTNDGNGPLSGHVRIYENQGGIWVQIGQDIDGEVSNDFSGTSVSLSSDGSIVAIGAPNNSDTTPFSGHVRVYENQNGTWTQIGQDINGEALGDESGRSVSLSSDGSIIAIGAPLNNGSAFSSGHVRVYENQGGTWTQIGQDIDGEISGDQSGRSVSLSSNGSIVAIGAPSNNNNNGVDSGHVRIYENQSETWVQIGQDINGEATSDDFGRAVSLSSDGTIVAIGAPLNDSNGADSGHVRIYENQGGTWLQISQDIDGEAASDNFGRSVSLSSDGNSVVIGANNNDDNGVNSGHVRIYENQSGNWVQLGQDIDGEATGDQSGSSISLSSDGNVLAIGALFNAGNGVSSGQVRIFNLASVLSTEEILASEFKLYPNPTKNQFTIELNPSVKLEKVFIYNTIGQLVLTSEEKTIDTSNLSSGSYIVELETNQGKDSKKLIID